MNKPVSFYIKPFLVIAVLCFAGCCLLGFPKSVDDVLKHVGTTATIMSVGTWIYIQWLWFYCPWEHLPRFAKKYNGELHHQYKGGGKKNIEIFISQTLLSVNVKIKTDEITSNSIVSDLVEENDSWILYYTYITNPQAAYSDGNPVQRGTARLEIEKPESCPKNWLYKYKCIAKRLHGNYWTSRPTIGDLIFEAEEI